MQYIMMSMEEAKKVAKDDAIVLLAVSNLETDDCNTEFKKRNFRDCEKLIQEAETIARVYDDFVNQLRVFTAKQVDVINYEPRGKLSTILLRE
ncbi:hypothetical protein [Konateibacter massiliensis]|uniref:hypothetical protein n=1 Tax=Konateibacter massiliensis TaxID=2002841 RepID=UPI000C154409|nr:hypothetical protein [Konateibacter massiliensis]